MIKEKKRGSGKIIIVFKFRVREKGLRVQHHLPAERSRSSSSPRPSRAQYNSQTPVKNRSFEDNDRLFTQLV